MYVYYDFAARNKAIHTYQNYAGWYVNWHQYSMD